MLACGFTSIKQHLDIFHHYPIWCVNNYSIFICRPLPAKYFYISNKYFRFGAVFNINWDIHAHWKVVIPYIQRPLPVTNACLFSECCSVISFILNKVWQSSRINVSTAPYRCQLSMPVSGLRFFNIVSLFTFYCAILPILHVFMLELKA